MSLSVSTSDLNSTTSRSLTVSMDLDPGVENHMRKYPSVGDYYRASSKDLTRPIQLQQGLSNFSSLQLGDDRIGFNESILSASYRLPVEDKMLIASPSKTKTRVQRQRDYQDATKKVGDTELNRLERVMKDKLFQRSYATSSPFQVRKAFKFFDREQILRISIEGFTRALEFLGFQFSEIQNLALFARYDPDCTGEIDYMNFITTAMFYAAIEPDFGQHNPKTPKSRQRELLDAPDLEDEEIRKLQNNELRNVFNKVDRTRSGSINRDEFELLLMALGYRLTHKEVEACLHDLGLPPSGGNVSFQLFFDWWTDSMGVNAIRKKTTGSHRK